MTGEERMKFYRDFILWQKEKIHKSDNFPSDQINRIPMAVFLMKEDKDWF